MLACFGNHKSHGKPHPRTSNRSSQGVFSHRCLRKASAAHPVSTGLGGSAGIAGEQRTMYHCASCGCSFAETKHTPLAHLKTPMSVIVQVLSALTEGVGINAATRLYGVSKNSIYRWQERLSSLKKLCCCCLNTPVSATAHRRG